MTPRPLIVIDRHIPFIEGLFEPYADVTYLDGDSIDANAVRNADALITRTRTRVDSNLLEGSRVKIVATATIGTDHIDKQWCADHGIEVVNAPGCNAPAVAQYVFASLQAVVNRPLPQHTIAIIGVGHIGRIVEQWARAMNMRVMLYDPPRQRAEGGDCWSTLDDIARRADIITVHTPMTREGEDATYHLIGEELLGKLKRYPIIINAARGPIVDTQALCRALAEGKVKEAIIDCWENEPHISAELLERAAVATPHIAGYSIEGKIRATAAAVDAVSRALSLPEIHVPGTPVVGVPSQVTPAKVAHSYDPMVDTQALRNNPELFEALRNHYDYRHEAPEAIND
jgi:erythronate-4-phosphate dehydrogenase